MRIIKCDNCNKEITFEAVHQLENTVAGTEFTITVDFADLCLPCLCFLVQNPTRIIYRTA